MNARSTHLRHLAAATLLLPCLAAAYDPVLPSFPLQEGWLGGDAAYSIPLGAGNRAVWLFGDTYVRNDNVLSRAGSKMIGNTIAIRTSDGVSQTLHYFWQGQHTASPDAFFSSGSSAWRYWPEDGFVCSNKLYVCLVPVQNTGDGPFDFQCVGSVLASVANPQDEPPNWRITYNRLYSRTNLLTGISAVSTNGYVYLYACRDDAAHKANRHIALARIAWSALDSNPAAGLEYLNQRNTWAPGPIGDDAKLIMDKGETEMTVRWHPERNCWVAIQMSNEFPSHHICRRQAVSLEGPWSRPVSIYSIPEYQPSNPGYGGDRFFYAGKEHIEFLNPANGTGVVTYAGDASEMAHVLADLKLYVPEPVQVVVDPPL